MALITLDIIHIRLMNINMINNRKEEQIEVSFNNSYLFDLLGDSNKLDHDH